MTAARRILPAGVALAAVFAGCGKSGPKVSLRFHPPAGAVYHFALDQNSKIKFESGPAAAMGEQQLAMHMYFTQAVGDPTGNNVVVTMTFDSIRAESPMLPQAMMEQTFQQMRGMKSTVVYDDRMHVQHLEFSGAPGMPPQMSDEITGSFKNLAFPFPDQPVGPGDSWEVQMELPMGNLRGVGPIRTSTKITVKEIQVAGADTSVLLNVVTSFPRDPVNVQAQGQTVELKFAGTMTGEQLFSLRQGAPVRTTMGGTMHLEMKGGALGGQAMAMSMEQQATMKMTEH